MARVEMATQSWGWVVDGSGSPVPGAAVTIKDLSGASATHYSAASGGTPATTALTTNADGTIPRFIDEGTYNVTISGVARRVEAIAGGRGQWRFYASYDTGNGSERVTQMALASTSGAATRFPIYSQQLPNLQVGDLVIAGAEAQVTNDILHGNGLPAAGPSTANGQLNVGVGHQLVMTADDPGSGGWVPGVNTLAGSRLSQANGTNVTPGMHHIAIVNTGSLTIVDASRPWVHMMAYVYNSAMQGGDVVSVDAGLGRLWIHHLKAN